MTDIAAPVAAPEVAAPTPSAQPSGTDTQTPSTPSTGNDLPPGVSRRADGSWAWKGPVDGEEAELDWDRAQHFLRTKESGQKRWQEAARLQREAEEREASIEEYLEGIKTPQGLRELARELKMSPREVAEEILAMELEDERLTPEQRELRELRAKDATRSQAQQRYEAQQREQQIQQAQQAERARLTTGFAKSMDRVGAPAAPEARAWIQSHVARLYVQAEQEGVPTHIDNLTKQAVAAYKKAAEAAFTPDDLLERVWADEALREKMRARYLEAAQPAHPSRQQPTPGDLPPRGDDGKFQRKVQTWDTANPRGFSQMLDKMSGR